LKAITVLSLSENNSERKKMARDWKYEGWKRRYNNAYAKLNNCGVGVLHAPSQSGKENCWLGVLRELTKINQLLSEKRHRIVNH
jgi:hypothetical protein